MQHFATIDIDPVEPVRIGFRQARGAAFRCNFTFRLPEVVSGSQQGPVGPIVVPRATLDESPQLVFIPRSRSGAFGYNLTISDAQAGKAFVEINGTFFNDPNGYRVELYTRDPEGRPERLIAYGELALTGNAYAYEGPLGPATLPTGPAGPAGIRGPTGPAGPQGTRGGTWFTGHGDPVAAGQVEGDMYLNEDSGDVWRWSGSAWMRGAF